jgi:chemotaxis protein MotB
MAKKDRKEPESSGGGWLTTYADLVTLLFAFFVLLYAFSQVEQEKFDIIASSLNAVLNGKGYELIENEAKPPTPDNPTNPEDPTGNDPTADSQTKDRLVSQLTALIEELELDDYVDIQVEDEFVSLTIRDAVVFDSGSADVKAEGRTILLEISRIFETLNNDILIEGHTDNIPINTPEYPSNWELSLDRALNVMYFFVDVSGLEEDRFGVVGFGENQPIADNDTPEGREQNRRVNILILFD